MIFNKGVILIILYGERELLESLLAFGVYGHWHSRSLKWVHSEAIKYISTTR